MILLDHRERQESSADLDHRERSSADLDHRERQVYTTVLIQPASSWNLFLESSLGIFFEILLVDTDGMDKG